MDFIKGLSFKLIVVLSALGLASCATTLDSPESKKVSSQGRSRNQSPSSTLASKNNPNAETYPSANLPPTQPVQSDKPLSSITSSDEAAMVLGHQAFSKSDFEGAERQFSKVLAQNPPSKFKSEALLMMGQSRYMTRHSAEALSFYEKINLTELSLQLRPQLFLQWAKAASQEGHWLESTLAYIKAAKESPEPTLRSQFEANIEGNIQDKLSEADLNFILKEYPPPRFPSAPVQLRLVTLKLASGQRLEAQSLLQSVISSTTPESKYNLKAKALLNRISSLQDVATQRIGLLVPLSGEQESAGRSIADGLGLALSNNSEVDAQIVLADAGPNVESAEAAFDRLVFEEKVMAIVGPMNGSQVERVASKAAELGLPYISISPRNGIIEKGPSIFRLALTPERQIRALVAYSSERLGAKNFAILFPEDNFGKEYASEFFRVVQEQGFLVTGAESYDPKQSDFRIQIENMIGKAFPTFRKAEAEDSVRLQEEKLGRKLSKKETESVGNVPIVDFDVIFIPDTYKTLGQIAPSLLYADVTTPHIMGPSSWHNPHLLERAGNYLENAIFVDMFASEKSSPVTKKFLDQFHIQKGSLPNALAAIGYDVGLALRTAFQKGPLHGRDDLRGRLETLGSLEGAMGLYNWDSKRDVLSEIQLYQIKRGAFHYQGGILLHSRKK